MVRKDPMRAMTNARKGMKRATARQQNTRAERSTARRSSTGTPNHGGEIRVSDMSGIAIGSRVSGLGLCHISLRSAAEHSAAALGGRAKNRVIVRGLV